MKKFPLILLILTLVMSLFACGGGEEPQGDTQVRYPIGLTTDVTELQIEVGETARFIVYMEDIDYDDPNSSIDLSLVYEASGTCVEVERDHSWFSDNLLEASFIVTAQRVGESTVTVSTPFTNVSCSVNVTVVEAAPVNETLSMGENRFNGLAKTTYTYTAPSDGVLTLTGFSSDVGDVMYFYCINNDGDNYMLAVDTQTDIYLNSGDVIEIVAEGDGNADCDVILLASWQSASGNPVVPEDPVDPDDPADDPTGEPATPDVPEGNYSLGLSYELSADETYYIVTGRGTCTDTELVIPPMYKGLPVKEIGDEAFYEPIIDGEVNQHNGDITVKVTIPSSVKRIGTRAFYNSSALTTVIIEVEGGVFPTDGGNAFLLCQADAYAERQLESVTFVGDFETLSVDVQWPGVYSSPLTATVTFDGKIGAIKSVYPCDTLIVTGGVDTVKEGAFAAGSMANIKTIDFNGVKTIEKKAFYRNEYIRNFNFEGLTSLGVSAFEESSIGSAIIPGTLTAIPEKAFYNSSLGYLSLGEGVKSIGNSAFMQCSFGTVNLGTTLTSIGNNAFDSSGISGALTIPANVTYIGNHAFATNQGISKVVMVAPEDNKIRTVGEGAFLDCSYLNTVSADGLTNWGAVVFERCYSLKTIDFGIINKINTSVLVGMWNYRNQFESITYDNNADNTKSFKVGNQTGKKLPSSIIDLLSLLCSEAASASVYERVAPDAQ